MTIFLIVSNIVLLAVIVVFFFFRGNPHNTVFSNLEDIELIEFQQNLKELIEQLHKVSENEIKDMDAKRKETEETIASADTKIKELRYLIDRNQLIRKSEYKSAIAAGPVSPEDVLFMEVKKNSAAEPVKKQKTMPAKFLMNETTFQENEPEQKTVEGNGARNKYEHINSLIKNGIAVEEIAKVTGLSRGEIELIKNIKR
jgi:hypothetical protein